MTKKVRQLGIRLTEAQLAAIEKYAADTHVSLTTLVRDVVVCAIEANLSEVGKLSEMNLTSKDVLKGVDSQTAFEILNGWCTSRRAELEREKYALEEEFNRVERKRAT